MARNKKNKKKKKSPSHSARQQPNPPPSATFLCRVPDGRIVDIYTAEGANDFIKKHPTFFGTEIMCGADPLRARITASIGATGRVDPNDADMLQKIYLVFQTVAYNATKEIFDKIAEEQIGLWLDHAAAVLKKVTEDPRWIRTGVLQKYDLGLLNALASCAGHCNVVEKMVNQKFLRVLSDFCEARAAPNMPCADVAQVICHICINFGATLVYQGGEKEEDVFKRLDDQGVLAQAIRCVTVPPTDTFEVTKYVKFLDALLASCMAIRKRFKAGSKTGDVLEAITEGCDGYTQGTQNPAIMSRLEVAVYIINRSILM